VQDVLTKYVKAFTRLRVAPTNGGAPHKPILLLSVLQLALQGGVYRGIVEISPELVALFRSNWKALVRTKHDCIMSLPFFHLKTSGFWKLVAKQGQLDVNSLSSFTKSLVKLDAAIDYAQLDTELAALIENPDSNRILQQAILQKYFPDAELKDFDVQKGQLEIFKSVEHLILNEDGVKYRSQMEQLLEQDDSEEVYLRGSMFKREVPKVYGYRCAVSGMRIDATANISMVDACHIVPFSESHDDTIGNGIALSPTLHRAFDRGLISFSNDYRVLVADSFQEEPGHYGIRQFKEKSLLLPDNSSYLPNRDNLAWHRVRFGFPV
jgi:putative restriction endonuclease